MFRIRPFYDPDPAAGGSVSVPDPSTLERMEDDDATTDSSLSTEDIDRKIQEGFGEKPPEPAAAVPPAAPAKETAPVTPAPAPGATPPVAPPKPGEPAPVAPPTLLAGKYKTADELTQGVLSAVKALGLDGEAYTMALDAAKAANDYTRVEAIYKRLETELGKKNAPAPPAPAAPAALTVEQETKLSQQVAMATKAEMQHHPVTLEIMRRNQIAMPQTAEELENLRTLDPVGYWEFKQAFNAKFTELQTDAREYQQLLVSLDTTNKQVTEGDFAKIKDFAQKQGIKVGDADLAALVTESQKSPFVYQERKGLYVAQPGGLFDYWMARKFPERLQEVRLAVETRAREEAARDLEELKRKGLTTISTASVPGTRQTAAPKVDIGNEAEVRKMGTDDLNAAIDNIFKAANGQ